MKKKIFSWLEKNWLKIGLKWAENIGKQIGWNRQKIKTEKGQKFAFSTYYYCHLWFPKMSKLGTGDRISRAKASRWMPKILDYKRAQKCSQAHSYAYDDHQLTMGIHYLHNYAWK